MPDAGSPTPEDGRGFYAFTVARPVALSVIFLTLIVVGVLAYREIPLRLLPSGFQEPELNLWIPNPGASAKENEEKVARVLEEELRTLTGIENVYSHSNSERVYARVELNGQLDLDLAKAEVRDRIERARARFPSTVENIGMWSEAADQMPLAFFGVLHDGDPEHTDYLMDKVVKPRLEAVDGVSQVDIWGVLQDSVRILLHEDKVLAARLDLGDLIQRLSSDNFAQPMGELDDGGTRFLLRTDMRFRTLEEIAEYPVTESLRIKDIGEVVRVKSVRNQLSRTNGVWSYGGMAGKESTANAVEATKGFRKAIEEIENDPALDGELEFVLYFAQGDLIENSLAQLQSTALTGGVLAVIVLFTFLRRFRLTLCVALSIPVSALFAIGWQYFRGESFNVLTMAGVTLAIGMLVDNSVVVIENVARLRALGHSGRSAARDGTREIALAVTLATLTSVVVFLPIIFIADNPMVRVVFGGIGLPLCASLLFSLLVALVFLPVVAARVVGPRPAPVERLARRLVPIGRIPARALAVVVGGVRFVLHGLVRAAFAAQRAVVRLLAPVRYLLALGVAALVFRAWSASHASASVVSLLPGVARGGAAADPARYWVGSALVPGLAAVALLVFGLPYLRRRPALAPARPASFVPGGDSVIDMVTALNRRLVAWTMRHRFGAAALAFGAFLTIAFPQSRLPKSAFTGEGGNEAVRFYVDLEADFTLAEASHEFARYEELVEDLKPELGFANYVCRFDENDGSVSLFWDELLTQEDSARVKRQLREAIPRIAGHRVRFYDGEDTETRSKTQAWFRLQGPDSTELEAIGERAIALLQEVPGLVNVRSPIENAPDQLEVSIDRDLAMGLGVSTESAFQMISWTLRGLALPRFYEEGREVPFLIEYDEDEIAGLGTLKDLRIWSEQSQSMVSLSAISNLNVSKGRSSIRRRHGQTSFTIQAEVDDPGRYMEINDAANAALERMELPRGYSVGFEDSARSRQEEEFGEMQNALLLSVVLVFLLMGILFESVLLPFSVLFTIPFAILGAIWTLFLTGSVMDFMGWIGLIILAGVVVNNGIVLIDRIHRLTREGMERSEAVVLGCAQRVRPVLMTALTTVFGLLPMALSKPATDAISYKILAIVVAGGLASSTFFTLWVVPLAYTVLDDLSHTLRARFAWWIRPSGRARTGTTPSAGSPPGGLAPQPE